jgi:hypothetical protein
MLLDFPLSLSLSFVFHLYSILWLLGFWSKYFSKIPFLSNIKEKLWRIIGRATSIFVLATCEINLYMFDLIYA